ncbi:CheY-like chemotaxis protein [Anaerotaenia torta]|uniref:response regulator n=1 Tax=Anaerotaenia torta TaxID=433293 RepID=UPI003D194A06
MKKILIVDNEVQILKALSRLFFETDYEIFTAENGMDALKLMETTNVDMVISDMRMPVLDGYQLLSIIKEKYPKIIRVILSGYTDEKPMYRALLHNIAKLYVFKPWNNNELLENINKLFEDDTALNSSYLTDMIEEMGCSSCIPDGCDKIISLIEEENTEAVIEAMEQEAAISNLLLQVGKSAVYGVMPGTIRQMVNYVGLHNLKSFMYWACVVGTAVPEEDRGEEPDLLWKHAYLTNRILLFLYETFFHKQPPDASMFAGLLHNIGLILLVRGLQKQGTLGRDLTLEDYVLLDQNEYELQHQEIGGHFIDLWELPFPMYEIAAYHHRPMDRCIIHHELVSCTHIAQHYAWRCMGAPVADTVDQSIFDSMDVDVRDFEKRLSRYLKCDMCRSVTV